MPRAGAPPRAAGPGTRERARRWLASPWNRALLVVVLVSAAHLACDGTLLRDGYAGDEAMHGVVALNMLLSSDLIVHPTGVPGGAQHVKVTDGGWYPPLLTGLLAMATKVAGGRIWAMVLVPLAAYLLALASTYAVVALCDELAAWCTVLLLAASPALVSLFGFLEPDPLLTGLGCAALYFFARADVGRSRRCYIASGALLGLAFLAKLWLVAPFVLAIGALFAVRRLTSRHAALADLGALALVAAGFLATASLHLLGVLLFAPADLGVWLSDVYFGIVSGTGSKFSGAGQPVEWSHPFWYYPAIIYRDHFFLLPLLVLGLPALVERVRECGRGALLPAATIVAGLSAIVLLSVPSIKEPLYILPTMPFLHAAVAFALASVLRSIGSDRARPTWAVLLTCACCVGMGAGIALAHLGSMRPDDITAAYALVHGAGLVAVCGLAFLLLTRHARRARAALAVVGLLALVVFGGLSALRRTPRDDVLAEVIRPHVSSSARATATFIAPKLKAKSLQLYLHQRGAFWEVHPVTLSPDARGPSPRLGAFVLGPEQLEDAELRPLLEWLERNCSEKTEEYARRSGAEPSVRVFVDERPGR